MTYLLTLLMASSLLLTACSKETKKHSSSSPAPTASPADESKLPDGKTPGDGSPTGGKTPDAKLPDGGVIASTPAQPKSAEPDKSDETDKGETEKKDDSTESPEVNGGDLADDSTPEEVTPEAPTVIPPVHAGQEDSSNESVNASSETGAQSSDGNSYISLFGDGLMSSLRAEVRSGSKIQVDMNKRFAEALVNGKMTYDSFTEAVTVSLKVKESGEVRNYNFTAFPNENEVTSMKPIRYGPYNRSNGHQNISASLICVDTMGLCRVAVIKLKLHLSSKYSAKAFVILRRQITDFELTLADVNTTNSQIRRIHQFVVNSMMIYDGTDCLKSSHIETFEVAEGVSLFRTLVVGMNGELFAHVGPLIRIYGSAGWNLRPLHLGVEDLDRGDLDGHTTEMLSSVATARLKRADGKGALLVNYKIKNAKSSDDSFMIQFRTREISVISLESRQLD